MQKGRRRRPKGPSVMVLGWFCAYDVLISCLRTSFPTDKISGRHRRPGEASASATVPPFPAFCFRHVALSVELISVRVLRKDSVSLVRHKKALTLLK
ncbi:hypothetical protein HanRHA438_Chr03g0121341 [Helianthus annuus]|nr:hypothetical protein HanIR_Chr03g0120611 [Helianthus annuus]KAJ0935590.1 hypothetical protein HanRHA438_Chr03g0121341 [Helianthus annuus]